MLKLAQLSDLHLLADPEQQRWGLKPEQLFQQVLAAALTEKPNALLLTGDLVHDESTAGYLRLKQQVEASGLPYLAIAGNHDDPEQIRRYFGQPELHLNGLQVIGLNSHQPGSDAGYLSEAELKRCEAAITASADAVLLAIHHPPFKVGSEWIDELRLSNSQQLLQLIKNHQGKIAGLVCGHVHQVFELQQYGVAMMSCPSTNRQFLPGAKDFACDQLKPGFRLLQFEQAQLNNKVIRLR